MLTSLEFILLYVIHISSGPPEPGGGGSTEAQPILFELG